MKMYLWKKSIFALSFCFARIFILIIFITMTALSWAQTPSPYWTGDGKKGIVQIIALAIDKWDYYNSFEIENREITNYSGKGGDLVIETIWGETINRIKERAFSGRQLTSVVIPDTVIDIWSGAFQGNRLTSITIPANVRLGYYNGESFDSRFDDAYNKNDKQAGTYVLSGRTWIRK